MSDTIAWIIALLFYAPIHYLGPALVIFLSGSGSAPERRKLFRFILIDCTLSMLLAFPLAAFVFGKSPQYAALILLAAMFLPYLHILALRRRSAGRS